MKPVVDRFLKYVQFNTMSDSESKTCPSTDGEWELARYLVKELEDIGMSDVTLDENGYVMATLKSNIDKPTKTVGFIAHMDTSDAMSGENVKPRIINYSGEDIVLNEELGITLSKDDFPSLNQYVGQDLIVTDGTTLLGADDKAGIAEIITAMEYLIKHPEIKHGDIKVGFTPDEEIGRGADLFNVEKFNADFAYTLDGGPVGELQYESFNAAELKLTIHGKSVHPGDAKNKLVNAVLIASEIAAQFPSDERPETTEDKEGFYHLVSITGDVEKAHMYYIIRDFERSDFEAKKEYARQVIEKINARYGSRTVQAEINDQYYNMKEKLIDHMYIVDYAKEAMIELGIEPMILPVRGGTDGSKLSFMGLPTPNIFAGGHNFHGKFEYIPVASMEKATQVVVKICELLAR